MRCYLIDSFAKMCQNINAPAMVWDRTGAFIQQMIREIVACLVS